MFLILVILEVYVIKCLSHLRLIILDKNLVKNKLQKVLLNNNRHVTIRVINLFLINSYISLSIIKIKYFRVGLIFKLSLGQKNHTQSDL